MTKHTNMADWLAAVYDVSREKGNPDEPFFYLGGPMTDMPKFNFPAFDAAAADLRGRGFNLVSPAELDSPQARAAALASPDGSEARIDGMSWSDFLERDVVICSMPNCQGGIFLPGWEGSEGATLETFVLDRLGRKLYAYGSPLIPIDRDAELAKAAVHQATEAA